MKIVKLADVEIKTIVAVLEAGGLVIFPTETTYGIGADATNPAAVKKLVEYKKRPFGKPFSIAVTDESMANMYAELNETAKNLYKNFLPGAITVISTGKHKLAAGVESETGTIGIRIPDHSLVIDMVRCFGKPITATSANASYKKRPYKIEDILENISDKQKELIDLIIDAGELPHREPSTVIDTTLDDPTVLRQGDIEVGEKNKILSRNENETQNLGKELWQKHVKYSGTRAIIYALEGPMGAGKTQFTKGLARAMGIEEEIVSPTYNLELKYLTPNPSPNLGEGKNISLNHIDAWRMQNGEELESLGMKDLINDKSVVVIEWAERVADEIRKYNEEAIIVWVKIEYGKQENERIISWITV